MCSAAMGLPVSGFPNMNEIMMEDEMGVRYLSTIDFIKSGVPGSILAMLTVITVGYLLMLFTKQKKKNIFNLLIESLYNYRLKVELKTSYNNCNKILFILKILDFLI